MNFHLLQLLLWIVAGALAGYFSLGNARAWTSIAVGFFLILVGEALPRALPFLPGAAAPRVAAMGLIVSTIAILAMSHGFQEYYVFSRTLEPAGSKRQVYLVTLAVIGASLVFVLVNIPPDEDILRSIRIVENSTWVFLSLINIDLIRKIYGGVKDSPIGMGFAAFIGVFACILLWKGSELYLLVYHLDHPLVQQLHPIRVQLSVICSNAGNFLAGLSVGGTFFYLSRMLR